MRQRFNYILTDDLDGLVKLPQMAIQELINHGDIKVNGKIFKKKDLLFKEEEIIAYEKSLAENNEADA